MEILGPSISNIRLSNDEFQVGKTLNDRISSVYVQGAPTYVWPIAKNLFLEEQRECLVCLCGGGELHELYQASDLISAL